MDSAYRFGRIEVSCEGFNHPDDPYILKGSCGLEYALELTEQGRQRGGGGGGFGGFASSFFQGSSDSQRSHQGGNAYHQSSTGGDAAGDASGLIVVALFLLVAYGVYKMFLCGPVPGQQRFPGSDPQGPDAHGFPHNTGPPPPGFKPDYTGRPTIKPKSHGQLGTINPHFMLGQLVTIKPVYVGKPASKYGAAEKFLPHA